MINIIKNFIARRKLKTHIFNYSIDKALDQYLIRLIDQGVREIRAVDHYHSEVTFNDGSTFFFWNSNIYYAWLSDGRFKFSSGSSYSYNNKRPSVQTMVKFVDAIGSIKIVKDEQ